MKTLFYSLSLFVLMAYFSACSDDDKYFDKETYWVLKEFVTPQSSLPQKASPIYNDWAETCYTLSFKADGEFFGWGEVNSISGKYERSRDGIDLYDVLQTQVGSQYGYESLYFDMLDKATAYKEENNKLYLYVGGKDKYLLFVPREKKKDIVTTLRFSLKPYPDCKWKELAEQERIYRINSNEELHAMLEYKEGAELPKVDFEKNTLLLISGISNMGVFSIEKQLVRSNGNFILDVSVYQNIATVIEPWFAAFLVNKMGGEEKIELEVSYR